MEEIVSKVEHRNLKWGVFASPQCDVYFERYIIETQEDLDNFKKVFPQIKNLRIYDNMLDSILKGHKIIAADEHPMSGYPTYCYEGKKSDDMHPTTTYRIRLGELTNSELETKTIEEFDEDYDTTDKTYINTIASALRKPVNGDEQGFGDLFRNTDVFFRPNLEFVKWLKDYANGRLIIDVGAGQGHLVRMLSMIDAKVMGLEPNLNYRKWLELRRDLRDGANTNPNEMLSWTIQKAKGLIEKMGADNVLLVFARPCHSDFVEVGINNMPTNMEALYITIPKNLERYNDLGKFRSDAKLLEHKGISEDNEVVYSIVRK